MVLTVVPALAQTTGSISGTVTDNTGALLPGRHRHGHESRPHGDSDRGHERAGSLPVSRVAPGTYALKYQLSGFGTVNREGIIITIGFTASVPVQLRSRRSPRR